MTKIQILSSTTVKPTTSSHHHRRLELTPCDLQHLLFTPMQRGLIYRHFHYDAFALLHRLRATLSRALDIFYPLAGRLRALESDPDDGTVSFSVDCCGAGALLLHAAAEGLAVVDVLDHPIGCLFPMTGIAGYGTVSEPFLAVQVTELVDGIFLAVSMSHLIADGTSFWHFINTWAHLSGGGASSSPPHLPPSFDRGCFRDLLSFPLRIPFSYRNVPSRTWNQDSPTVQTRIIRFSRRTMEQLKAAATVEARSSRVGPAISSLQALMAHLWVCITRCRGLIGDDETSHMFAVGLRGRMQPPLASEYFGNAVRNTVARSTAGELLGPGGFGLAARRIREAIAAQTPAELRRFLEGWVRQPVFVGNEQLPRNLLYTGASPRFDLFGNDFGWGPPVAVQRNRFLLDGNLTPSAGAEEGSIDLEVTLLANSLQALAEDPEFRGNFL